MAQAYSKACDHDMPTRRAVMTALAVSAVSMTPVPGSGFIHEQREAGVYMAQTVETLLRENIHGVFSEADAEKRRQEHRGTVG